MFVDYEMWRFWHMFSIYSTIKSIIRIFMTAGQRRIILTKSHDWMSLKIKYTFLTKSE